MFAQRTSLIAESNTSRIRHQGIALQSLGVPVINFARGELDLETSEYIKLYAERALHEPGTSCYTETLGLPRLREWIAEKVSQDTGALYHPEEVGVTSGAKQALFSVALALFEAGDEVIIPVPAWGTFEAQVRLCGAKPVFLDTTDNHYQINLDTLASLINAKTRAIILNTPNNPTGAIYDEETLKGIADLAEVNNLWIIFDECYEKFVYEPYTHHHIVRVCEDIKKQTVIINSFSKTYAITGWRIGYVAAPESLMKVIQTLQGQTISNASSLAQHAVLATFEEDHAPYIARTQQILTSRLEEAVGIIGNTAGLSLVIPQGAFYLYPDMRALVGKRYQNRIINDARDLADLLLQEVNVAVVPGNAFGDPLGFRISYAIDASDITEGLYRIKNLLCQIR